MTTMNISPVRVWRHNEERRRFLGKEGTLVHFSVVRVGPTGLSDRTPYVVGLIKIGNESIIAQLADVAIDELRDGMQLVGMLRRLFDVSPEGVIVYGVKFVPHEK